MDEVKGTPVPAMADPLKNPFSKLPIEVRVIVGRARPTVEGLLSMSVDSVLSLDRSVTDPVELFVGDKLIARGVLEEVEGSGQLAVRLLEVASDKERL